MARKKGQHLTWNDRLIIERMLLNGFAKKEIATAVGCCLATVYNEIKRSTYIHTNYDLTEETRYNPDGAEERYRKNLAVKGVKPKLERDIKLREYIEATILEENFSPAAVLMKMEKDAVKFEESVCVNTIYKWIEKGIFPNLTLEKLPEGGKRKKTHKRQVKKKQQRAVKGTSIEKRPDEVKDRETFGHWEMDTVIGKQTNRKNLLVLTERKTRYEVIEVMKEHTADEVRKALNRIEKRIGSMFYCVFLSITVDNGSEFADFEAMEKALYRKGNRTDIYYCHPHAPHERGSNEVTNKLIRRFFPKGADFDKIVNMHEAKKAEAWLNSYPRKLLNGRTAAECFDEELCALEYG